jgi:hypothetical protein
MAALDFSFFTDVGLSGGALSERVPHPKRLLDGISEYKKQFVNCNASGKRNLINNLKLQRYSVEVSRDSDGAGWIYGNLFSAFPAQAP